jgi:ribosomal protein S18 acetylase RimI-like enzyme
LSTREWLVTSGEQDPDSVERLLRALPHWFGIEASVLEYIEAAHTLPTYLARSAPSDPPVGVLLVTRHFPGAAEIHVLAVQPDLHRSGVGRALVDALVADLVADGVGLLQVKTLGPSREDAGYAKTRQFYTAMGFQPLEERHDLWDEGNPCLFMVKVLAAQS